MANYFTLITQAGLAKIANAQLTSSKVEITEVVVGDGNGTNYSPTGTETQLKRVVWRGGVTSLEIDAQNPNWIVVEAVIPATVGGFTIREVGLYDAAGTLIAIGNYPDTYKPVLADGSTMDLALRTIIEVNNTDSVTLKIDPNVIVASRAYVDARVAQVGENPTFKTKKNEIVALGPELITNANISLGAGWAGTASTGFTHTSGSGQNLIIRLPFVAGQTYEVALEITNPAVNDNGQSDYYLSLSGSPEFETYKGRVYNVIWGIKALGGNELIVRPWEQYNGTLKISIKQVTGVIDAYTQFRDSDNAVNLEQRISKLAQNSIYLGLNTGRYVNKFAEQNVMIGNNSGRSNTSGFWNTAVGYSTLQENTVGSRNIAIGRIALQNNISGTRNIALGPFALRDNTIGINNIGIGADAVYKNIQGEGNIGIGTVALGTITNAEFNIAIGDRSMSAAPGGNNNVALGRRGLYTNSGNNNVGIGEYSLFRNTTGSNNFASGNNSAYRNTTGSNNVAIGLEALYNNAISSGNVAIGPNAMRDATGGSSIAIGSNALRNNTANNNIALGVSAALNTKIGEHNLAMGANALTGNTDGEGNVALGYGAIGKLNADGTTRNMIRNVVIGKNAGVAMDDGSNYNVLLGSAAGSNLTSGERNIIIGNGTFAPNAVTSDYLNIGGVIRSQMTTGLIELQKLRLTQLPTTAPTGTGMLWNDEGTLKIT